jgi:hypothetical protein
MKGNHDKAHIRVPGVEGPLASRSGRDVHREDRTVTADLTEVDAMRLPYLVSIG